MTQTRSSYRGILKASSLIGGASVINILIGMVRTKFVAVLLGADGVGLMGMYTTIIGIVSTLSGMGINSSGVRQVAEAYGCGDEVKLARTVRTLRRTVWLTGGLGMLFMVAFCVPLSRLSFKTAEYAVPLAILGTTVLLGNIALGQGCVIQGTRRIADMAKISVIGGLNGTLIGVPLYGWLGQRGILPSLVLGSLASLVTSWWFARRVPIKQIVLPWHDSRHDACQLLRLGVALMSAALLSSGSAYLIRLLLMRELGLSGVGIYQAAFNLSGILVTFVLGAMAADYYPRLTAVAADNGRVLQVMNDQTEIALLLALPGLAAMVIFSPILIRIFYAPEFTQAIEPLRWFSLGLLGRVLSWPLGFILLAKAQGTLYFLTELVSTLLLCALTYWCVLKWGVTGAGVAFFLMYVFYLILMVGISMKLAFGVWRRGTSLLAAFSSVVMVLLMLNATWTTHVPTQWGVSLTILVGCSVACLKRLFDKTGLTPSNLLETLRFRLAR